MTPRPFRFGVVVGQARSGDAWLALARRAEELGYSTLLVPDTLGQTLAPLPALAAAAAATRTLRVGPYVLANDYRNPVLMAREAATLDALSGGRFELGLGAGRPGAEADYRQLGIQLEPGATRVERLEQALAIITDLLEGRRAEAHGPHYTLTAEPAFPPPVQQPRPPILIAAAGGRMLALAARAADIVALALRPDVDVAVFHEKLASLRQAAGDRFDRLELNVNLIAVGADIPAWLTARMGLDPAQLARSSSPSVLLGTTDEMCARLTERREALGVSYITLSDASMEAFAPVVERLAGR